MGSDMDLGDVFISSCSRWVCLRLDRPYFRHIQGIIRGYVVMSLVDALKPITTLNALDLTTIGPSQSMLFVYRCLVAQ